MPFGNIITYRRFKSNSKLKIHLLKPNSVKIILMSSTSKPCIKKQMQNWYLPFGLFYVGLSKKKLKMNPFFVAQFNYRPLIWMTHNRFNNNYYEWCLGQLHKWCLRLIYSDKTSSYKELLEKDGWVSITKTFKDLLLKCLR